MEYSKDIISRLLDIYERRNGYAKRPEELRSIQFEVSKEFTHFPTLFLLFGCAMA